MRKLPRFLPTLFLFAFATTRLSAQTRLPDSLLLGGTMADTVVAIRLIDEARAQMFKVERPLTMAKLGQAEAILKYTLGEENFHFARCMHYTGYGHMGMGDFELTDQYYRRALRIYQNTVGDHERTANLLNQIGANHLNYAKDPDEAIAWFQKSKAMTERLNRLYLDPWHNLALAYQIKGDNQKSLYFAEQGLEQAQKFIDTTDIQLGIRYQQAAVAYANLGDYDRAITHFQKSLKISQNLLVEPHEHINQTYKELGDCYNESGDYELALEYYQRALSAEQAARDTVGLIAALSEMGRAYLSKGDYDRAERVLQQAQEFESQCPIEMRTSGNPLYLGYVIRLQGKMQEALEQFHKALDICEKKEKKFSLDLIAPLLSIGNTHTFAGEYQIAAPYFQRAMEVCDNNSKADHPYIAIAYNDYADFFQRQGQFEQADSLYQRAWRYFRYAGTDSLAQVHGLNYLLPSIYGRGNFYRRWYQHTGRPELLARSLQTFEAFDEAVGYQRQRLSEGSKTALSQTALSGYEGAIASSLLNWQESGDTTALHRAFNYSEKAHALQLFEALREAEALQFSGIPDTMIQREHDLRVEITYLEKCHNELIFEQNRPETDTLVLALNKRLAAFRHEYESLKTHLARDYPDYFQLKYAVSTTSPAHVKDALLQPGQTLLEYFVGDSSLYVFVLSSDTFLAKEIKRDFPLDSLAAQMRGALLSGQLDNGKPHYWPAVRQYAEASQALYQHLLKPVEGLLGERLIIVPDGILTIIPFEALLKGPPPTQISHFKDYPYLLRQHAISYCYSATLLREMKSSRRKNSDSPVSLLLAMAPFSQSNYTMLPNETRDVVNPKTLRPLPATGEEVTEINKIWAGRGTVLLGANATKDTFMASAGRYHILQLATHGKADYRSGDYSYLAFADSKDTLALLHVRDIYNLSIRAELVVLSACETGVGKIRRGEGVVSLARAFSYAGAKSLVTTLWPTDDAGSKNLMIEFHRQLKLGQSKDTALQKAKFQILNDLYTRHPFYWASFVVIGDETGIEVARLRR